MFTHTLTVRFRDLDALNHVNNSVYLTYLEETRIAYMAARQVGGLTNPEQGTILAHCEIDYRRPALLADTLRIELGIGSIRHSSFEFTYRVIRQADEQLIAQAMTVQVCYNYRLGTPIRIPGDLLQLLQADQHIVC